MATKIWDSNGNLSGYNGKPSKAQINGQDADYNAYLANKNGVLQMQPNIIPEVNPLVTLLQSFLPNVPQDQLNAMVALQGVGASPSTTIPTETPIQASSEPTIDYTAQRNAWIQSFTDKPAPFTKGVLKGTLQIIFEANIREFLGIAIINTFIRKIKF